MALCGLCQSIPFGDLPEFPGSDAWSRIADDTNLPEFEIGLKDGESSYPLGFPWHESLEALAEAAKLDCPLCNLVEAGAQAWLDSYQKGATTNEHFIKYSLDDEPIPHGQRLWICKRRGKGAGFAVLIRSLVWRAFVLLTGVSFSVDADHPLAQKYPLRPIAKFSGSSQSLDVATRWLEQCANSHEECASGDTLFPSRVLDVGSSGDNIKLVEPKPGSVGKYACLSHCWGVSVPLTTTRETCEARMANIRMSELPQTFRDAVAIARQLGIRYLWIDSLCIFQDDRTDWARESANMTAVYSNAHLVIAIDHAADSSVGAFHNRPPRPGSKMFLPGLGDLCAQLVNNKDECPWLQDFEDEVLTTRGWGLQESVLATRILHFATRQMHFECARGRVSEDGCHDRMDFRRRLMRFRQTPSQLSKDDIFNLWYKLLWDYGERRLTHVTDKLPAMSGLAKMFSTSLGTQYVAGIWSDTFIAGLAWQCIGLNEPMSTDEYTGPSWSWPSYGGIAAITAWGRSWKDVSRVEEWHAELQDKENPYGGVTSAWVRISCPMTRLDPSQGNDSSDWESRRLKFACLKVRTISPEIGEINDLRLDHKASGGPQGEWRKWDLSVIILGGYSNSDPSSGDSQKDENNTADANEMVEEYFGLAVIPVVVDDILQWKRVGWVGLDREEGDKIIANKQAWVTATLI